MVLILGYRRSYIIAIRIVIVVSVHTIPRDLPAFEKRLFVVERDRERELLIRIDRAGDTVDRLRHDLVQVDTAAQRVVNANAVVHLFG